MTKNEKGVFSSLGAREYTYEPSQETHQNVQAGLTGRSEKRTTGLSNPLPEASSGSGGVCKC